MCTKYKPIFDALAAPFESGEVHQLLGRDYVKLRTIYNRLDEVVGPENWWDERTDTRHGVKCRLTLRMPDGVTITHEGHARHMPDPPRSPYAMERVMAVNDPRDPHAREKAERSEELRRSSAIQLADDATEADAFKRGAVKFGVARYLYREGVAELTQAEPAIAAGQGVPVPSGTHVASAPSTPPVPPSTRGGEVRPASASLPPAEGANPKKPVAIKTGLQLYRFAESCRIDRDLLRWMLATFTQFPQKVSNWSQGQVEYALPEIKAHLEQVLAQKKEHAA